MFDEICQPYSWERDFYEKNNIPMWDCRVHETVNLGRIYTDEEFGYIEAEVTCLPAQFWKFKVHSDESEKTYIVETGSGSLSEYFDTMVKMVQAMLVIELIEEKEQTR